MIIKRVVASKYVNIVKFQLFLLIRPVSSGAIFEAISV